jgi:Malate/L-lactate dehydrogenases
MKVSAEELRGLIVDILLQRGLEEPQIVAEHFVEAELRGHSSHGVQRVVPLVKGLELGTIRRKLEFKVVKETPSSLLIDAMHSVGITLWASLIQRSFQEPISIIAVRNASHIGFLGYYTERLARKGYVTLMIGNAEPSVVFPGKRLRVLSTTPISISIPHEPPFVLDMALSATSRGKIIESLRRGEPIQPGLAVDEEGNPTTDPGKALRGGLLPMGGTKGFFLMLGIELLVSFITSSAVGPEVKGVLNTENPPNKGEVLIVINPQFLESNIGALSSMRGILDAPLPGEHSLLTREKRLREGIDIDETLWKTLMDLRNKNPYFSGG